MIKKDESIIQSIKKSIPRFPVATNPPIPQQSFNTGAESELELEKRKKLQELAQQDRRFEAEMEQHKIDRELKKRIATMVFSFLAVETFALFFIILLQGFAPLGFKLEDSTINIFLGATLLQISSMAVIITRHLYPTTA